MIRPLLLVPVVLMGGLFAISYLGMQNGDQALPSTMEGRAAPAVTVAALGPGPVVTQEDLRAPGVKLVNFWASWCQPCRVEHPMLEALAGEGLAIYGINYKDDPEAALGFLEEMGNPYAGIGADSGRMAIDWGVYGVPETFVIDGQGVVVLRWAGPITAEVLERTIRPAIAAAGE